VLKRNLCGLRWHRLEDAQQSEFFRWFHLVETKRSRDRDGGVVVSFRPEGPKFYRSVRLAVTVDREEQIVALYLILSQLFVDGREGIFARDIAKSFLRVATPFADENAVTSLAEEIEKRHNFPVITRDPSDLTFPPSAGFLAFAGEGPTYKTSYSQSSLKIERLRSSDGDVVAITLRANDT